MLHPNFEFRPSGEETQELSSALSNSVFDSQIQERVNRSQSTELVGGVKPEIDIINSSIDADIYSRTTNRAIRRSEVSDLTFKENPTRPETDDTTGGEGDQSTETNSGDGSVPKKQEPDLRDALEWAKRNMSRFDDNNDKGLDKTEMGLAALTGEANEHDLSMLRVLHKNYDKLRNTHFTDLEIHKGKPRDEKDAITTKDVQRALEIMDFNDQIECFKVETEDISKHILQGEPPLFDVLDRSSNGEIDGKISRGDLKRFLENYEFMKQYGDNVGPFTAENARVVKRMMDTWNTYLGPGNRLRGITNEDNFKDSFFKDKDDYEFITRRSIVRGNGFS